MRIIADDKIPFLKGIFEPYCEVIYHPGGDINKTLLQTADALIVRTRTRCNASLLEGTTIKAVATATIGTDHLDIPWMERHNIKWTNAPGCNSGSVKQYIASVLARLEASGIQLENKTLGIVGVGNVGSKVKEVAEAFGMHVLLNDPPRKETEDDFEGVDLDTLLQNSDLITFHVPLTNNGQHPTHHLFDSSKFPFIKKGCILINTSRGEVVDQQALLKALKEGLVNRAILDVWENEPNISTILYDKLMIGTPHIAGYSIDGKANGTTAAVQFVSRCFDLPLNNWLPEHLPDKENKVFELDFNNDNTNLILAKAVLHAYDVNQDHNRLASNPANFEILRGNYPIRREFPYFTARMKNQSARLSSALSKLGFNVII